jgi:hypothetical protein
MSSNGSVAMETARAKMEKYGSIDYYSKKVVDFIDAQTPVFSASPDTLIKIALSGLITQLNSVRDRIVREYPTMLSSAHADKRMVDLLQEHIDTLVELDTIRASMPLQEVYSRFVTEMTKVSASMKDVQRILGYFTQHTPKPAANKPNRFMDVEEENVKTIPLDRLDYIEFAEFLKAIDNSFKPGVPLERKKDVLYSITKDLMKYVFLHYPHITTDNSGRVEKFYDWLSKKEDAVDDMTESELRNYAHILKSHLSEISVYNTERTLEKMGGGKKRRVTRRRNTRRSEKK